MPAGRRHASARSWLAPQAPCRLHRGTRELSMLEFALSSSEACSAPQGSSPAPTRLDSAASPLERQRTLQRAVAADEFATITRPGSLQSAQVHERDASFAAAPHVAGEQSPRSRRPFRSRYRVPWRRARCRETHSTYAVTDRRRVRPDQLRMVRREILMAASGGSNCSSSSAIPCCSCSKRQYPRP